MPFKSWNRRRLTVCSTRNSRKTSAHGSGIQWIKIKFLGQLLVVTLSIA